MADHKKNGVLGSGDKIPNHGSSGSQSPLQKRIADLESWKVKVMKVLMRELCCLSKFEIT